MTKHDFCREVARRTDTKVAMATDIIDATIDTIRDVLADGDSINFLGFGKFVTTTRSERMARNPINGDLVKVPERVVPKFRAASKLKEHLN